MYSKEEYKQLKTTFWTGFSEYCATVAEIAMRKPFFMLYDTKVKGVELKFDLRRDSVDVAIEVNSWGREEKFDKIKSCRALFAEAIDELKTYIECADSMTDLVIDEHFVRETGVEVSRVYVRMVGIDFHKLEFWPTMYVFMAQTMIKFEEVFFDVREILKD